MKVFASTVAFLLFVVACNAVAKRTADNRLKNYLYAQSIKDTKEYYFDDDEGNLIKIDFDEVDSSRSLARDDVTSSVIFHLYTNDNVDSPDVIVPYDTESLANSHWDANRPTRIVCHGWMSSSTGNSGTYLREAYLNSGDYNVIAVDWSAIAQGSYLKASGSLFEIGGYVANLINFLETEGLDVSDLVMVGHSLGAHVVGLAGYQSLNVVGYIIGLDPALPMFWFSGEGERISTADAAYVQIIHTDVGGLGYESAIGHIDFYPNGGEDQPGCIIDVAGSCSHRRSYKYFAESLTGTTEFVGTVCRSYSIFLAQGCRSRNTTHMGGSHPTTTTESGSYFLRTNSRSPYARGA